jgi:hypothetical protein
VVVVGVSFANSCSRQMPEGKQTYEKTHTPFPQLIHKRRTRKIVHKFMPDNLALASLTEFHLHAGRKQTHFM